ncbi:DUF4352 domain-containing protein [Qaidamihabitans albus]|uniref:DUF4352 domain-containing protein n=1 Tax=Qaidamihabitans albus TaxID=2795733 RepID=UPI0027DE6B43|nr:DUF4352 domain-containing protein [Qaidamihabitans albus]
MRRTPKPILVVLCALLGVTACGTSAADDDATTAPASASSAPTAGKERTTTPSGTVVDFGSDHRFSSGLVVTVSPPNTFRPSESAYPQSARAAAFGIAIYNNGEKPYRLSSLSVTAMIGDRTAEQVVDATRGYNGIVDADKDVQPGQTVRVVLAFAVPEQPTPVRLCLRPDAATSTTAVYGGSV